MKILQINNVHYRRGGADAVYLNTAELLKRHGDEVVFFNMKKKKNLPCKDEKYWVSSIESRPEGILSTLIELRNFFYNPEASRKIEELIVAEKPDIAHVHLFWGCGISPSITKVLKNYHIPLIQTVHDYRMVCPIALLMDRNGNVCERCQGKHFYKSGLLNCSHHGRVHSILMAAEMYFHNMFYYPTHVVDGFIYVSKFAQNKHLQYMPKMKDANSTVIYNFTLSDGNYDRNCHEDYLLYYGRLSHEKGIETLLSAVRLNPHINIKVVGTGPMEEKLRMMFKTQSNIQFLGYKTGDELNRLVRNAKFVCVPSEWYENNPMTIVEAYSMGTPVVGAKIGGIPEIIIDGKTGYLFESGDLNGLCAVLDNAILLNTEHYLLMRKNAYLFYKEFFSPERHYQNLLSFYKHTMDVYEH